MDWSAWVVLVCVLMQWGLVAHSFFRGRRMTNYLEAVHAESRAVWHVLVECAKVLEQYDDFNSRHARKLITEVCEKFRLEQEQQGNI